MRSGFTVTKALFFNFLSALVALAGTALVSFCFILSEKEHCCSELNAYCTRIGQALSLGKDPGHSSLIEVCCFCLSGFYVLNTTKAISIHPYYLIEIYPFLLSFEGNPIFYTTRN